MQSHSHAETSGVFKVLPCGGGGAGDKDGEEEKVGGDDGSYADCGQR